MRRKQGQAKHLALVALLEQFADGDDVAEALRHLLAVRHRKEAVVHPVAGQRRAAMGAAALGDLVLVMGKNQIEAATMNVDRLAEMRLDHRRAFDMPAGTAARPGAFPSDRLGRRRLPQDEVCGILLVVGDLYPGAGDHRLPVAPAQNAVIGVARHVEEHMAGHFIGVAGLDKTSDHLDHLGDMLGGVGRDRRLADAQRAHVVPIMALVQLGDRRRINSFRPGRLDDLVVDVGDVAGIDQAVGAVEVTKQARERVEDDRRAGIADMRPVVDGRTADIHRHATRIGRGEDPLLAGHRVVKADRRHCAFRASSASPCSSGAGPRRASTRSTIASPLAWSRG